MLAARNPHGYPSLQQFANSCLSQQCMQSKWVSQGNTYRLLKKQLIYFPKQPLPSPASSRSGWHGWNHRCASTTSLPPPLPRRLAAARACRQKLERAQGRQWQGFFPSCGLLRLLECRELVDGSSLGVAVSVSGWSGQHSRGRICADLQRGSCGSSWSCRGRQRLHSIQRHASDHAAAVTAAPDDGSGAPGAPGAPCPRSMEVR